MRFQEVESLRQELASKRPLNAGELKRIQEDFAIQNTYSSNAIEGSTLTLGETRLVVQEGMTIAQKPLKYHFDAVGHKHAIDYITDLAQTQEPLSIRDIIQIHSLVLMEDMENRGVFRQIGVHIVGATHKPPDPALIPQQLNALLNDYPQMKAQKHILQAIAEFHLLFEGIHPFIDGNGRTGRLIMNLELIRAGYLPIDIKYADKDRYFSSFDAFYTDEGGYSSQPLTDLIILREKEQLYKRIEIISPTNSVQRHLHERD